jgi:hypothetical protein
MGRKTTRPIHRIGTCGNLGEENLADYFVFSDCGVISFAIFAD